MAFPNSYNSFITGLTSHQLVLPPAVYSWTVTVQSGTALINGLPVIAGNQIKGGGYGPMKLNGATSLIISCTGGNTLVNWDA